jgi:hypothetical protein
MNRLLQALVWATLGATIASAMALLGKAIIDFAYPLPPIRGGDQLAGMCRGVGEAIEIFALLLVSVVSGGAIGATTGLSGGLYTGDRQSRRLRRALTAYWGLLMLVLDTMVSESLTFTGAGLPWGLTIIGIAGLWVAWCAWDARRAIGNLNAIIGVVAGLALIPTGAVCFGMLTLPPGPERLEGFRTALAIFGVLLMSLVLWLLIASKRKQIPVSKQDVALQATAALQILEAYGLATLLVCYDQWGPLQWLDESVFWVFPIILLVTIGWGLWNRRGWARPLGLILHWPTFAGAIVLLLLCLCIPFLVPATGIAVAHFLARQGLIVLPPVVLVSGWTLWCLHRRTLR